MQDPKLDFYIKNNINVLFVGRHGTGKTTMCVDAFNRAKIKWKYFSASTMDPWVDFVGIPRAITDPVSGNQYVDLVRPKEFSDDTIEALFFDEFNRCLTGDTKIQLANGHSVPIKDLIGQDHFYVYSYDVQEKRIRIGKGHSARKTGIKQKIIKVTLDNGQEIRCTPDHPFLLSNGEFVFAEQLKTNSSLMPLYKIWFQNGYEQVWNPKYNFWEYTHILADEFNLTNGRYTLDAGTIRHHVDFDKLNNSPENVKRMTYEEHFVLHRQTAKAGGIAAHEQHPDLYDRTIGKIESRKKALRNSIFTRQNSLDYFKKRSSISKSIYTKEMREYRSKVTKAQWGNGQFDSIDRKRANRKLYITKTIRHLQRVLSANEKLTVENYEQILKNCKGSGKGILSPDKLIETFGSFEAFVEHYNTMIHTTLYGNHRVVSIEPCGEEDVYDITVDDYHNFALEAGVFVHNSPKKVRNAVMELIQFKSINGKKFPNLRMVWAAINPDDDPDAVYDVDKLDPAQIDRFQVKISVPYKPSVRYFTEHFGAENAKAAVEWWTGLSDDAKKLISPRRLDYAISMFMLKGDVRDVLPSNSNVTELVKNLKGSSLKVRLNELYGNKNVAEATEFLARGDVFMSIANDIIDTPHYAAFFLPLVKSELLSTMLSKNKKTLDYMVREHARFGGILREILTSGQNTSLCGKIRNMFRKQNINIKVLEKTDATKVTIAGHPTKVTINNPAAANVPQTATPVEADEQVAMASSAFLSELQALVAEAAKYNQTYYKKRVVNFILKAKKLNAEEWLAAFDAANKIYMTSYTSTRLDMAQKLLPVFEASKTIMMNEKSLTNTEWEAAYPNASALLQDMNLRNP